MNIYVQIVRTSTYSAYVHLHTTSTYYMYMYIFPDPPTSISHDQVHTSLVYPLSPSDNVTVNISLPVSGTVISDNGYMIKLCCMM